MSIHTVWSKNPSTLDYKFLFNYF